MIQMVQTLLTQEIHVFVKLIFVLYYLDFQWSVCRITGAVLKMTVLCLKVSYFTICIRIVKFNLFLSTYTDRQLCQEFSSFLLNNVLLEIAES